MLSVVPRNTVHDVVNNAYYAVMGHNENVSVVITVFFDKIFEPCFDSVKKSMGTFAVGVRFVETEGAEKNARIFAEKRLYSASDCAILSAYSVYNASFFGKKGLTKSGSCLGSVWERGLSSRIHISAP